MKKIWLFLVLTVMPWSSARAAQPTPDDFAWGLTISIDQQAPIYEINLPRVVYENVVRPDLGDLRIFNRDGEVVPHVIKEDSPRGLEAPTPAAVPFFPLYGEKAIQSTALRAVLNRTGMIIDIDADPAENGKVISAYLLDLSMIKHDLAGLEFYWTGPEDNLVTRVDLAASPDLNSWSKLVSGQTLADIKYGSHHLKKHYIRLAGRPGPYLRLLWPAGREQARLTRVKAVFAGSRPETERRWITLSAVGSDKNPNQYFFDAKGFFPVDRIEIKPPQKNTLVKAALSCRNSERDEWRGLQDALIYNLQLEGSTLTSEAVRLNPNRDRYYSLLVDPSGGGLGSGLPTMELGWTPQKLYFLARGQAPYTLAFGSGVIKADQAELAPLLLRVDQPRDRGFIRVAQTGTKTGLGGPSRLKPPAPPRPLKQMVIWAVLIAGVIFLGFMAWRLSRQMKSSNPQDGSGPQ